MDVVPTALAPRIAPRAKIRAVLYDIYGTLFISRAGDIGAARHEAEKNLDMIAGLCSRYSLSLPAETVVDRFFETIEAAKGRMLKQGIENPEVAIEDIWSAVLKVEDISRIKLFALEYEMIVNPVYPMPHLQELFAACREKRIPMGIISNAQFYTPCLFPALLGRSLHELGFRRDLLFFSYLLGYGKPSVQPFEEALRILEKEGIEAISALYVGNDMLKDITPAAAAGFQTALFAGDARSLNLRKGELPDETVSPDLIVTELDQIIRCFGEES
jgi:putative hydrolase of the HAD superfamily